ncbi:MAG: ribosome biogenesis GTPase Der [Subdoligranulum sp.]
MAKPIVAIVGRPNVGKSTLFNKLTGQRLAIVEDTPGVTRDRIFCDCEWCGHKFLLVDTGGIEPNIDDGLLAHMREQAQIAIDSADCIIMVGEIGAGVTAQDQDIAGMLMRSGKPVVLAVNKCDKVGEPPMELYDFYSLGIGDIVPISSVHGHGTGDLLDTVCENLHFDDNDEEEEDRIPVAVIGRPNVGKSSLINHILGENRLIVANEAGTTRDAIDTMVENQYGKFIFTDTAGLRKRGKVESGVERYSVLRSLAAVERSRVCVIMIDATVGFTEQDSKVAGYAHDQGKACIIAVNKWDAVEKDSYTMDKMRKQLEEDFSFMSYAPILFISAKTGQRLDKLFETIQYVDVQNGTRIPTGALNEMLARSTARVQPPSDKDKRLKIFYITQSSTRPPTFVAFVNQKALFHFSYQRYIENQIRENFGLTGTPMRLLIREHGDGSAR